LPIICSVFTQNGRIEKEVIRQHIMRKGVASAKTRSTGREFAGERTPMAVNPAVSPVYVVNPLGGDALQSLAALFRTHPMTADRVARLEEMASEMYGYPRQRRPLSGVRA
jgi:hypothetical protein